MTDAADLEPGALVVDSDADPEQQNEAVVVNTPPVRADKWDIGGCSVAEYHGNEPYDDASPVVLAVYRDELEEWRSYQGAEPISARLLAAAPCRHYAFPRPRLELVDADRRGYERLAFRFILGYGPGPTPQALDRLGVTT
jgi:hypothetical protein